MDASQLALRMLDWEKKRVELDALEEEIKSAVLLIGGTQVVGNVRASYNGGRRSFDYEGPVMDMYRKALFDEETADTLIKVQGAINEHTRVVTTTDWRSACKDLALEAACVGKSDPSVTIKLEVKK